jgi:hypothetical protein
MSAMTRFREIVSKYDSSCGECGEVLAKGEGVWWKKGERVRCGDCTPDEERALWSDLASRASIAEREKADGRKYACLDLFPFIRKDKGGAAAPLLERLRRTNDPAEIHALVDLIDDVTEPARPARPVKTRNEQAR